MGEADITVATLNTKILAQPLLPELEECTVEGMSWDKLCDREVDCN